MAPGLSHSLSFLLFPLAFSSIQGFLSQLAAILHLPLSHSQRGSSIITMGAFPFHDAYSEAGDFSVDESDSEQAASTQTLLMRICWSRRNWAQRRYNETWQMPLLRLKKWRYKDGNGVPQLLRCPSCISSY